MKSARNEKYSGRGRGQASCIRREELRKARGIKIRQSLRSFDLRPQIEQPRVASAPGVCPFGSLTTNGTDFSETAIDTTAAGTVSPYSQSRAPFTHDIVALPIFVPIPAFL